MKKFWLVVLSLIAGGGISLILHKIIHPVDIEQVYSRSEESQVSSANLRNVNISSEYPDFTYAAEECVKAVVFVKVVKSSSRQDVPSSIFDYFFGFGGSLPREQVGTGSGVIVTDDGYIVTNNHVISGATEIEVTIEDNKVYKAELVGTDPATDIALLKIDAKNLPTIGYGDSDNLRLGEWVLAIGSPYGLTSTITAGIVSAKGRQMPSYKQEFKIESFIQTDAAVNPGNSGGALVNIKGELVGINTAIYSETGSYSGYSFAVPVNIVKKIVEDFKDYGGVQRAVLGITMQNNSEDFKNKMKLSTHRGVYISEVATGSAAEIAGLKKGDVILAISGTEVKNGSSVQEIITRYRPGDKITVDILREDKPMSFQVTLIAKETQQMNAYNMQGNVNLFGALLVPAPKSELDELGLKWGVKVEKVEKGKIRNSGIKEGFIITYINNSRVASPSDVSEQIKKAERSILIEGVYPDGNIYYYGIGI